MTQATDFTALDCATVLHFVVISGSEPARAVSAEFETYLLDRSEKLADFSDSERRESDESAFEFVRRLEQLDCVVSAGVDQAICASMTIRARPAAGTSAASRFRTGPTSPSS